MSQFLLLVLCLFSLKTFSETISTQQIQVTPKVLREPTSFQNSSNQVSIHNESNQYMTNFELHKERKLGAGLGVLGIFGYMGGVADINFDQENTAQVSFGKGHGYNTFFAGWKKSFEGQFFTPYFTLGYSRFYNSLAQDLRGNSYIIDQILSKEELRQGPFGIDFLNSHFGMQYNQLSGEYTGSSFYLEFNFLLSPKKGLIIPTASLGSIYYF